MRTVSRIFIILGLLALITIACSYLYLRSNYIIEPLVKLIKEQTGYTVSIENVNYNPLYPDRILLKHIKVEDSIEADQIYVEFDSKKIIKRELEIRDIEIINARVNVDRLPLPSGKGDLFRNITIKDLHLKDFTAKGNDWSIDDSIMELSNLDIVRNHKLNIPKNYFVNMFANRVKYNDLILHSFNTTFHYTDEKITIDEFRANFKDGTVNSQIEIHPYTSSVIIKKLDLNKIETISDFESLQNLSGWQFDIYDAQITDCSLELQDLMLSIRNMDLTINDMSFRDSMFKHISVSGKFRQMNFRDLQIENSFFAVSQPLSNPVSHILFSGNYSSGSIETYIKYNLKSDIIDVHELTIKDLRLLDTDFSEEMRLIGMIPFTQVNFRVVNIQDFYYDSANEYNPVLVKNGNLFLNNVVYRNGKFRSQSRSSHIDISADELSFTNFEITDLLSNMNVDTQGQIIVDSASAIINRGTVTASGSVNTVSNEMKIHVTGKDVGFDYLNTWLKGHQTVGRSDFDFVLTGIRLNDSSEMLYEYDGKLELRDVFISNFDPEQMKNAEGSKIKTNWIQSLSSAKNLIVQAAQFRLKKEKNIYRIDGTVDALSRLYSFSASLHDTPASGDSFKIEGRDKTPE